MGWFPHPPTSQYSVRAHRAALMGSFSALALAVLLAHLRHRARGLGAGRRVLGSCISHFAALGSWASCAVSLQPSFPYEGANDDLALAGSLQGLEELGGRVRAARFGGWGRGPVAFLQPASHLSPKPHDRISTPIRMGFPDPADTIVHHNATYVSPPPPR